METKPTAIVGGVVIVLIIVISVLCTSYADLNYYEMGFKRHKITGAVDTAVVFTSGRHWIGPSYEFKVFQAISHNLELQGASVFTKDSSLEIVLDVNIRYFLIPEDLKLLHDAYDVNYEPIMQTTVLSALKNAAQEFTLEEHLKQRSKVQRSLHISLQRELGGICCPVNCNMSLCFENCKPRSLCTDEDKGRFVDPRYFQMTQVEIPRSVEERNLRALVLVQETEAESFRQTAALIDKETSRQTQVILNDANEITSNASATASLLEAQAQASYQATIENARRDGLKTLFGSVNFTDVNYKNSFDYLRSLGDSKRAFLTVDFDQLIAGPTNIKP